MIGAALFAVFLWPIQLVIQVFFLAFLKVDGGSPGWTVVLISLAVNSLLLPIYRVADRWQREERDLQNRMRPWVRDIRAVFRGDERHMILATYHRQMGYHPLFSLRSSLGLLIQIPFFFAAYDFLAHAEFLRGQSFLLLTDLSQPDALVGFDSFRLNVLPFLMTAVNLASAFLYSRGLAAKDKVQLFGLAAVFLVLLYNSPSGLVLYWTVSNLFSLGKNAAHRSRRPGFWLQVTLFVVVVAVAVVPYSGLAGPVRLKFLGFGSALAVAVFLVPWIWARVLRAVGALRRLAVHPADRMLVLLAGTGLAILSGLVLPGLLIQSSPSEFLVPLGALLLSGLQAFALFCLVPLALWFVAPDRYRRLLAPGLVFLLCLGLVNAFLLPSGGVMNQNFQFTAPKEIRFGGDLPGSVAAALGCALGVGALWGWGRRSWLRGGLTVVALGLGAMAVVSLAQLAALPPRPAAEVSDDMRPVVHLSPDQPNTVLIFLDRAVGVGLPLVLDRYPTLKPSFDGFTYYRNTVSFGQGTSVGAPSLLGGYEYTPEGMAARPGDPIKTKMNEALTLLTRVHDRAGYSTLVSNIPYGNLSAQTDDLSPFPRTPGFTGVNLKGVYRNRLMTELGLASEDRPEHQRFSYDILVRFSLFRMAPPAFRPDLYRNGTWWQAGQTNRDFDLIMESYSTLHFLPQLTDFSARTPTYTQIYNETTHENGAFGPDLRPNPWDIGISPEDLRRFHDRDSALVVYNEGACLQALARWFDLLRASGGWDRTTVVVVADHGVELSNRELGQPGFERFNPLLLVKPAGASGPLRTSDELMTNADVPWLVTQPLGPTSNPFTGVPLRKRLASDPIVVRHHPTITPRPEWFTVPTLEAWRLQGGSLFAKNAWKPLAKDDPLWK